MNHPHSDPTEGVPSNFCIKPEYRSRPVPNYFEDKYTAETGMVWQPDVYAFGAAVARKLGCNRIIDLGCGHGEKLSELQGEFETIGVDFGSNLEYCRSHYCQGQWLEADFEQASALAISSEVATSAVVICSDVIEHMINPKALLAKIKALLENAVIAIISTPERDLTWGAGHNGPPPNVCHTREWNLAEFVAFLSSAGMTVEYPDVTRSNDQDPARKTILAVVGNSQGKHLEMYASRGVTHASSVGFRRWLQDLNYPEFS